MQSGIRIEEHNGQGRYILPLDGGATAELTFRRAAPDQMLITYTSVPRSHEGQGLGRVLVEKAVEDARANGVKITPLCGYVAAQFRRTPAWHDVLAD